jgi:antitoxin component YwqK of YwqJK toxin-antitoxin module
MHEKDWYVYGPIIILLLGLVLFAVAKAKKGERKGTVFGCLFFVGTFGITFGGIIYSCTSSIMWDGEHTKSRRDFTERLNYVDEQKHGLYESWYTATKTLKEKGHYDMGDKVGVWETWHENGQLESSTDYSLYNPYRLKTSWHDNGQIRRREYIDKETGDRIYSKTEEWYENGNKSSEGYGSEYTDGTEKNWYVNGQLHKMKVWKHGMLLHYERYNEDGSPCRFTNYKNGNGVVADDEYSWNNEPSELRLYENYKLVKVMSEDSF